jgi:Cthe_2314-like HEPN
MAHHLHLSELPGWVVMKGSETQKYRNEVLGAMASLSFTHEQVLKSANRARFLIQEINSGSWLSPDPQETYNAVQDFVYHYENYCLRAYILREKIVLYLNAALQIGFKPKEVNIKLIIMNPATKEAGLMPVLEKFDTAKKSQLGTLIKHRKTLTHHASYGITDPYLRPEDDEEDESDFQLWCRKWARNIVSRAKEVDVAQHQLDGINHMLAEKVVKFRESKRPKNRKS